MWSILMQSRYCTAGSACKSLNIPTSFEVAKMIIFKFNNYSDDRIRTCIIEWVMKLLEIFQDYSLSYFHTVLIIFGQSIDDHHIILHPWQTFQNTLWSCLCCGIHSHQGIVGIERLTILYPGESLSFDRVETPIHKSRAYQPPTRIMEYWYSFRSGLGLIGVRQDPFVEEQLPRGVGLC